MRYHRLSDEQLWTLSAGVGGPAVMAELNASRISLHLLLFRSLADRWTADPAALDAGVRVLGRAQAKEPSVYAELVGDPLVGAWLTRTSALERPTAADFLHLGGLAAVAALRAGLDAELTVHADAGRVVLPTLGDAVLDAPVTGPVGVRVAADGSLTGAQGTNIGLRPLRRLGARHGDRAIAVRLEDSNPYRDGYHAPPSERVPDDEADRWQKLFADAWRLLAGYLPEWAGDIAHGLRAVVPLVDEGDGSSRSGTARESVGAMGMTPPSTAADMAITLVHEFHHSKLSAVIDMTPLYRPGGTERHEVPWKKDERPTSGVIQGVYAFLGVADTWHHLTAAPELAALAERQFERILGDVEKALPALEGSTELTDAGRLFTAGMRARFDVLRLALPR